MSAKPTIKMFLNTVSPENAFIIGETVVLGTDSAVIYEIQEMNTDVMTVTFLIDEISNTVKKFAGQTANLELSQPKSDYNWEGNPWIDFHGKRTDIIHSPELPLETRRASIEFDELGGKQPRLLHQRLRKR